MSQSSVDPVTSSSSFVFALPVLDPRNPDPIRADLMGLERLDGLARSLAADCVLKRPKRKNSPLLRRFEENGRILVSAHARILAHEARTTARETDAEWLADNFHIVDEVLREVRQDLPPGYDVELPKLAVAPLAGYPRVYALALALIAHTDSELDEARITRFVQAFQEVAPLAIGELWALPTMFRLVLLENLRRLAEQMLWGWNERERADRFAQDALSSGSTGKSLVGRLAPPLPSPENPTDPFVVRILQLFRDQGASASTALDRLESELLAKGVEANETLRREHRRQAANQVSVGNCVIGLRLLSVLDWNTFFERVSRVEAILREDPSGIYALQDFPTRDRQRRTVEMIARRSKADEERVACRAVELAEAYPDANSARGHVGFYLWNHGAQALKTEFGYRARWSERHLEWTLGHPRLVYFGFIILYLIAILAAAAWFGLVTATVLGILAAASLLIPMSEVAVCSVNHLLTLMLPPRVLAKRELKDGIPADCATIVVMPSLLARPKSAEVLLERLEIHALANPDPNLRFALLTDFSDADEVDRPEDDSYLHDALDRVEALNAKYNTSAQPRFFLFHRRRIWNPVQGKWMGWERKRGKLSEFNRLVRGATDTSYATLSSDPAVLRDVRYVITLDADTQMPRDTARRLVGTLAHPLNRPRFDTDAGRVVEGHAVLQPRVSFHLTAASHSKFAAILASSGGIDPYSAAASDTYMDLFGIGSFTGKGIYDLDAFEAATGHTFPENQILSHDLIEGNYARCGLLSDTELFDDFPARYHAYARREHRWVRGDWQLLPWLFPKVPTPEASRSNPLQTLERWKLFDNLRRSLVPPSIVLMLILGWTVLPGSAWAWTIAGLAVTGVPLIQLVVGTFIVAFRSRSLAGFVRWRDSLLPTFAQVGMTIAFLADQARNQLDAISRTLSRLFVTHKNMLEWETAASTDRRLGTGLPSFFVSMWPAPAISATIALLVAYARPASLPAAAPILAAWALSPVIAWWVSRPRVVVAETLTSGEQKELRSLARKTWLFFETFVGDADNWLPPDNHQEIPDGRVAHRTSPTNQGLLLLSTLSAHDFGYIGTQTLVSRLEKTFDTFDKMGRHWGQFYNWYDTRTLEPLPPAYISTVDSGNLLGCLVTTRRGFFEIAEGPAVNLAIGKGLSDSLRLANVAFAQIAVSQNAEASPQARKVRESLDALALELDHEPKDLEAHAQWLVRLDGASSLLRAHVQAIAAVIRGLLPDGVESWTVRIANEIALHREELSAIAPWLEVMRGMDVRHDAWKPLRDSLIQPSSFKALAEDLDPIQAKCRELSAAVPEFARIANAIQASALPKLLERLESLADRAEGFATAMDFKPLYKSDRNLYAIGSNLVQGRLDNSCYDLLASESCLTSFLAVARGDAPRRHWFMLGRPFIRAGGRTGLISWGGTMFEYLMPRLMLKAIPGTLVAQAAETAVFRQIEYGAQTGVPWGISESAFNAQYVDGDYQYQSFGVPGLGLKRGLEKDLVIAPYATALATMIAPRAAIKNLRAIESEGGVGRYGLYEAIDYTPDRVPKGARSVVIRQYMAHHQGMSLVAFGNTLLDNPMPRRFHTEPMVRAVDLLLQERIPRDAPLVEPSELNPSPQDGRKETTPLMNRRLTTWATPAPRTHILSNTQYHVMLTNAGSGRSTCRGKDVTRWREDPTRDDWGQFIYLRDSQTGTVWSAGFQPIRRVPDTYEVIFSTDKATFRRRDGAIETLLEVTVSPEALLEVRRVTLTNHDVRAREIEVTSYAEIILMESGGDGAHPAFGKLFVETEWLPGLDALLCRRRPRSSDQPPAWSVHVVADEGACIDELQYETDRDRFLGRGRSTADPAALDAGSTLSGTVGPVLDPIVSIRRKVRVAAGASTSVSFTTAVADSREQALIIADQYREASSSARAFEVAWAHSQVEHRQRDDSATSAHLFQRLASHILYSGSALRANPATIAANHQPLNALWRHGISGDRAIVLVRIADTSELALARVLVDAHAYLSLRGMDFDLVLWNEEPSNYLHELHQEMLDLVRGNDRVDRPGGVFVRKAAHAHDDDKILIQAVAKVVLIGDRGPLATQLDRIGRSVPLPPPLVSVPLTSAETIDALAVPENLAFFNGIGGFSPDGREYVIVVRSSAAGDARRNGKNHPVPPTRPILPPNPWINVVANSHFGFLVSESGAGMTWAVNSQANRLTPWSNDPVSDPAGEALYLRDETTGTVWNPTAGPVLSSATTIIRHAPGYTVFEKHTQGIAHELTLLVAPNDPVKLIHLKVRNLRGTPRRLSATYFAEWVLGSTSSASAMHIVTEEDAETGALLARNASRVEFGSRVAFLDVNCRPRTLTADRSEFLGRHGSPSSPAALKRVELSGRTGAAIDPCGAVQTKFVLEPNGEFELVFVLGEAETLDEAQRLIREFREPERVVSTLASSRRAWDQRLDTIRVRTPDPAMDILLNGWLIHQTLTCRVWARSAFYQSGGAFGFRDQLQDVMALILAEPAEVRMHLLRAASRQFVEGDVQHWWHPPTGRGVRTRISDDLLWLPYVVAYYINRTGDTGILEELVPYLKAPLLKSMQHEDYGLPGLAEESENLYEHCLKAIDHSNRLGAHGLPLMGTGDWNDGMNQVGAEGIGESVWLAWFRAATLDHFGEIASSRGDLGRVASMQEQATTLRAAIEATSWDGEWYMRAFFDDGTPLGSKANDECQIDSLPQTWAVIAGGGDPERAEMAMEKVLERLVRRNSRLILLFDPPFDTGTLRPGYIKGYLPGIRENGGQYTHAATWVALACAKLGRGRLAHEMFDLLNPIRRSDTPEAIARYRVEPYVLAGDIYGRPPHEGRGGWSWYTGSSGWLYRVGLHAILGFEKTGNRLRINPCIPAEWPGFEIQYHHGTSAYILRVVNPDGRESGVRSITVDGRETEGDEIELLDDGVTREVVVVMGPRLP